MFENIKIIVHGFLLSIGLILPIGPQNMFILLNSITHKQIKDNMAVVGAAVLSDAILIIAGVSGISGLVSGNRALMRFLYAFAFLFLIYIGVYLWRRKQVDTANIVSDAANNKLIKKCVYIFSISMFNPQAILDTVVVIGISSINYVSVNQKTVFAAACIITSAIFFTSIVIAGKIINKNIKNANIKIFDKVSAILMWIFAGNALIKFIEYIN